MQWRADHLAAIQLGLVMSVVIGFICFAMVWFGEDSHPLGLALGVACALFLVGGTVYFVRSQLGLSVAGNPLAAMFASNAIRELGGLQFAVRAAPAPFGGVVLFAIQNCFDAPRSLHVALDRGDGQTKEERVDVGPLAVVRAEFPVVAVTGPVNVDVKLYATGDGGSRVRTWIAHTWENSTTTAETAVLLAFGVIKVGGGIQAQFAAGKHEGPTPEPVVIDITHDPAVQHAIKRTSSKR